MHVQMAAYAQNPKKENPKRTDSSIWENEGINFDIDDDDKDGIKNAEDLCPSVPGTKANKGCPDDKKTTATFISKENFETIVEASCNRKLESYIDKSIPGNGANAGAMVATTLPKTGVNNNYPVYYQTDGKGSFITIVILSNNIADNRQAAAYVTDMIDKLDVWCLKQREKKMYKSAAGDSTIIRFERDVAEMIDEYMDWQVFNYKQSPTEQYVMLAIKNIPYTEIANRNNAKIKNDGLYNKTFCDNLEVVYKESVTAFKQVRRNPKKRFSGDWEYETSIPLTGFTDVSLTTRILKQYGLPDEPVIAYRAMKSFVNDKQAAEQFYKNLVKQVDGCGNFTERKVSKPIPGTIYTNYTIQFDKRNKLVELLIADVGDGYIVVSIEVRDENAVFKKDD